MRKLTIRMDDETYNKLQNRLLESNISMNKFVNDLVLDELLKPVAMVNSLERLDQMLDSIYKTVNKIDRIQYSHFKVSKQHFANRGFLSNAEIRDDKCLK